MTIDLNADVGESFGPYTIGDDEGLMKSVTSVSIAAGFHGGDPSVLRSTIQMAKRAGVAIGVHPGFPDLAGFGRRNIHATPSEVEDFVLYQIAAVAGVARAEGMRVSHVKPHGALYNMAAADAGFAVAIARAVAAFDPSLLLVGPPASQLTVAGRASGLRVAAEAFADRAYKADGTLVARSEPGSVLVDPATVTDRVLSIVTARTVSAVDGSTLQVEADTICFHGDTPGASDLAATVRRSLETRGIVVRALDSIDRA